MRTKMNLDLQAFKMFTKSRRVPHVDTKVGIIPNMNAKSDNLDATSGNIDVKSGNVDVKSESVSGVNANTATTTRVDGVGQSINDMIDQLVSISGRNTMMAAISGRNTINGGKKTNEAGGSSIFHDANIDGSI